MNRKLQVGDLVKDGYQDRKRYPGRSRQVPDRYGFIIEEVSKSSFIRNKVFKVLWTNGEIGNNIFDYDLELVK